MHKALVITIGTEITCGEVVNSNAAWVSAQLEEMGVRVFSHLSVRDHKEEIARALAWSKDYALVIVTGGLGPTSDDMTRACMADYTNQVLEFDEAVWTELSALYAQRQLPLREAHRHQCYFPADSERMKNPVGTALGFYQKFEGRDYFILPGPPRELEAMWQTEVAPRLHVTRKKQEWVRWTCLGVPESEVAELVEKEIAGHGIEVGYRAHIPYVKVKVYVDLESQSAIVARIEAALIPFIVSRGHVDLAEEVLKNWPAPELRLCDHVTGPVLAGRLLGAWDGLRRSGCKCAALVLDPAAGDFRLDARGEELVVAVNGASESRTLPYRVRLDSERGGRSAAEWALWFAFRCLPKK